MRKRILILGHSGLIGRALTAHIGEHDPAVEIIGLSLPDTDLTRKSDLEKIIPLLNTQTTIVLLSAVKRQLGDRLEIFRTNMEIVSNVAELIDRHPIAQLVYFSSAAVYGEEEENTAITEQTPVKPTSYYGIAKFSSECLFQKTCDNSKTPLLILRPPLIYGLGEAGTSYGPSSFVHAAVKNETITLWGDGSEKRDFVFAPDAARAVFALIRMRHAGILNLATGQSSRFSDIVETLSRLLRRPVKTNSKPRSKAKVDNGFDTTALQAVLPELRFSSLDEGLGQLLRESQPVETPL